MANRRAPALVTNEPSYVSPRDPRQVALPEYELGHASVGLSL